MSENKPNLENRCINKAIKLCLQGSEIRCFVMAANISHDKSFFLRHHVTSKVKMVLYFKFNSTSIRLRLCAIRNTFEFNELCSEIRTKLLIKISY